MSRSVPSESPAAHTPTMTVKASVRLGTFRSEVRFWRGRTDTAGLSARTLLINAGCSLIVLAYLWEGEGTNRILLLSSSADFAVQAWKALTLVAARAARARARRGARARRAADEARAAAREAATESFDALAFGAVGACVLPLGAGLALHTLVQYPHRSWWAWLLDASAKAVYLFGFVAMTPQLFVNYKLKSVSYLPWRVLCYKAFTTFVDDAFSLLVSMPTAHRVACLRDDLVFFALLYQRRCFPVDLSRANEYGYAYAPAAAEERAALECAPAAARAPGGGRADAHSGLRRVSLSDRSLGGT
ncbi:hypothetical protein KFE25_010059 [Diacronema lutheri]|uniref:Uncharacterized protein n=1 Tax=Diacronema lutheri TaxID=2081491 RepID=A0A8J6CB25_DIALT|nr:hypothetical protein KFE25_010059 [Diacronema lutheri]